MGDGGQHNAPGSFIAEKYTVPTGGWVSPRASLEACENLTPTGIRCANRPACSESLYLLSYPDPHHLALKG